MKTKIIYSFLYLSALVATAKADYLETTYVKSQNSSDISAVSPFGAVALGNSAVELAIKGRATTSVGDRFFYPNKVNDAGTVVGVSYGSTETDNDFAFFTSLGGISQLLLTSPNIISVALNSDNKSAVIEKSKVTFFNAPIGTAAPVQSAIANASAAVMFTDNGESLFLLNGDLIVAVTELGTPRFARVTQAGVVTVIPPTILPGDAKLFQTSPDGKIIVFINGSPARVDFTNPPAKVFTKADQIGVDFNGTTLLAESSNSESTSGFPQFYDVYLGKKNNSNKIECYIPKKDGITDFDLFYLAKNGDMIGKVWGKRRSGDVAILTPNEGVAVSFCPQVSLKIIGECKKNIKSTDGQYFNGKVKKNTRCEAEVTIKDGAGKPIANKSVVSNNGAVLRGKTNKDGKVRFKFLVNGSSYLDLQAPYGDKKLYSQSLTISAEN